jgi:hemerythrin-like domain-containing protein
MAAQNILTTLRAEHDEIRGLFDQLKDTTDRAEKTRGDLLNKILSGLVPHAKWEEQVFYPEFKRRTDRDGLQTHAEAVEEHRAVEMRVIPDVLKSDVTTPEFAGRSKVFGELIDHHATEEEKTMFKMARDIFSADELKQLDEDYKAWKTSVEGKAAVEQAMREFRAG